MFSKTGNKLQGNYGEIVSRDGQKLLPKHYENMPMQYTEILRVVKKRKFSVDKC